MITTTFKLAKGDRACRESYMKFARHVGGIRKYGEDTPIPLTDIADVCSLGDALWCLRCTEQTEETKRLARLLAADYAEHVLLFFEEKYPDDDRPRKAIEVTRLYAKGLVDAAAWAAAGAAAMAAAWDAAWDTAGAAAGAAAWAAARAAAEAAAWDAAWDAAWAAARDAAGAAAWDAAMDAAGAAAMAAAWDAEREWQLERFKEVM